LDFSEFGSLYCAASSWDRPRRVIVKAEHKVKDINTRFIVANVQADPQR
jgi:hypothetical protein